MNISLIIITRYHGILIKTINVFDLMLIDPSEHIFIFGDLNMDLKSKKGNRLRDFLSNNELKNYVNEYPESLEVIMKKKYIHQKQ